LGILTSESLCRLSYPGDKSSREPNDLSRVAESWRVHVEAANLSPNTIKLYLSGVRDRRSFLDTIGMPTTVTDLNREHIEA
jgi:hypothetical protein